MQSSRLTGRSLKDYSLQSGYKAFSMVVNYAPKMDPMCRPELMGKGRST